MEISIIILTLILSAFFSGMEIAFVSSNKVYLGIEKMQNGLNAKILSKLTEKPSRFIATMLIGNKVSLVIYGFFMGDILMKWIATFSFQFTNFYLILIQILISTLLIVLTSEVFPKVYFQIYANSIIKTLAIPAYFFYSIFYFITSFLIFVSDCILKTFFRSKTSVEQHFFSRIELGNYISQQINAFQDEDEVDTEIQIFQNALEFSGVKVREIMNPRTDIAAIEIHESVANLKALFIKTGYSKLLVYQNSLDNIIGYVHSFELFKKPKSIKTIMTMVEFVPETILIKEVMNLLTKKRKSVAVVLDEFGGTSGMVTIEDIVEELFGEIEDEHDDEEEGLIEKELENGSFLFSARLDVEYLNQEYKLDIPESESYSTLGGFIVNFTNEIPQKGEEITFENYFYVIEAASNNKIDLICLTIKE